MKKWQNWARFPRFNIILLASSHVFLYLVITLWPKDHESSAQVIQRPPLPDKNSTRLSLVIEFIASPVRGKDFILTIPEQNIQLPATYVGMDYSLNESQQTQKHLMDVNNKFYNIINGPEVVSHIASARAWIAMPKLSFPPVLNNIPKEFYYDDVSL